MNLEKELTNREKVSKIPPYSLNVKSASDHFGFAEQTLYQWVNNGRLVRGIHYLKVGVKVLIIREAFIDFMEKEDGSKSQGQ